MENYTIYDEIGRGTHSFVYKARRKRSIEYVAVKSTAKTRMEKILNEVQLLHKLDSRYVLKFFNWYESQNHIWLIFEYCIGGDLLNLITQDRRLPEPAVKTFGWELVAGLRYLHANGILYCDLKPANILIDECGSLKLADFGLARRIPTAESMAGRQLAPGSPNYMAPELFQPAAIHSYASDFWALGCVLYELCTGRPPFTNTFFPELARIIQNEPLMIPREGYAISPSFEDLLQRLLEKDPYRRITWDVLLVHPFWTGCEALEDSQLPAQELFEASRPENRELHNESLSISIRADHEHRDSCDENTARGERSSITETTSDGSTSNHHSDHEDPPEERLAKSDDSQSESGSDSHDEMVAEVVGVRKVRPVTAPTLMNQGSERSKAVNEQDQPVAGYRSAEEVQQPPRMKTAPASGSEKRHLSPVQSSSRKPTLIKASRLLFVGADATVKPIAVCDDIESIVIPPVNTEELDFEPVSPEILLTCAAEDLEYHLKSIYISLKSTEMTLAEKNNVLAHLFSLSQVPKLANVILNSSLLTLLIKMLRQLQSHPENSTTSSIVSTILLILGGLVRLGTFISSPSPEHIQSLVATLNYFLEDHHTGSITFNAETKHRAVSCLGELLFYLAAQQNGSLIPAGASSIVRAIDDSDPTTRHYAIRTVTNILARAADESVQAGFVNEQTGLALVRCLDNTSGVGDGLLLLKTSVTEAVAQLFRQIRISNERSTSLMRTKVSLMTAISKPTILASLWRGVAEGYAVPELSNASLNVLNSFLEMSVSADKVEERHSTIMGHKLRFLERAIDIDVLVQLLEGRSRYEEHDQITEQRVADTSQRRDTSVNESRRRYAQDDRVAPTLLRAKAILFVHFGILHSMAFARQCIRSDIVDKLELALAPFNSVLRAQLASPTSRNDPLGKATAASPRKLPTLDQYLLQCSQNVVRVCIRTALKMSAECISASNVIAYEEGHETIGQPFTSLIASEPFQLFEQLIKNPTCCSQLCYFFLVNEGKEFRYFVRLMSKLLTSFSSETLAAMGSSVGAVISRLLLRLFQSSASDAAALVATEPVELFSHLLPAVVVQLLHPNEHGVDKIGEDEDNHSVNCIQLVYLVMLHLDYELNQTAMLERDRFLEEHLMPCFKVLMGSTRQNENVWRFAIELLHGLVTRHSVTIATLSPHGLVGPILALLSSPVRLEYHSLPSTATALVREVVEWHKNANTLATLFLYQIAQHVNAGIEYVVTSNLRNSGTVHLLEVLHTLLLNRYDERRKSGASSPSPAGFDELVECGPWLLQLCAQSDPYSDDEQPHDSPRAGNHAAVVHLEVLDAGSRCLVYLSQIFGPRLNEVFFGKSSSKVRREDVAMSFVKCLESPHDRVLHYVLLTLKNALRCDAKGDAAVPVARRWLQNDKAAMAEIVRITKRRAGPSTTRETRAATEQVVKTASEIVAHLQNTRQ